jgi:hypothetical protein
VTGGGLGIALVLAAALVAGGTTAIPRSWLFIYLAPLAALVGGLAGGAIALSLDRPSNSQGDERPVSEPSSASTTTTDRGDERGTTAPPSASTTTTDRDEQGANE